MYSNPIVVDGTMYLTTPSLKAVALDAATGSRNGSFDPAPYNNRVVTRLRNRGVAYWKGAEGERIFDFVRDRAYAIDAKSGRLIRTSEGRIHRPSREPWCRPENRRAGNDSPGAVYKNLIILGSRVDETYGASPGYIRAYDAVTGH